MTPGEAPQVRRAFTPVSFHAVEIDDAFWAPRLRTNRARTLPAIYRQLKETGHIDAFKLDWRPGREPIPHFFWDSDVAKWIEAMSYSLAAHPDPEWEARLDEVAALIGAAQQPDGYLNVYFTTVEPDRRWTDLRDGHELYCAGHLMEAAVAHYEATGKRNLLDPLRRYADRIAVEFGRDPEKRRGYCGHAEIELALVRLYRATGDARYLELSRYFVDERGQRPHYFDREAEALRRAGRRHLFDQLFHDVGLDYDYRYNQSHLPVREQSEVTGHAVRAMYLYTAMADLAGETGDGGLFAACERLWRDLSAKHLYITGGIGSARGNEGFTAPYDLPNETAYCETCAAIGLVFWNHRLLQLDCDSRYADVTERALFNVILSGVSLDGERFFYENPLASDGGHHRQAWFGCACCPPNLARLLASLGDYIYAQNEAEMAVHLYIQGSGRMQLGGQTVVVRQETRYPWEGRVSIRLEMEEPAFFGVRLRLPGWCGRAALRINGRNVGMEGGTEKGYIRLERTWRPGDRILLDMSMSVVRIYAHPDLRPNAGCVALQRGPIVYCLEQVDHSAPLHRIALPRSTRFFTRFEPALLGGVTTIAGEGLAAEADEWRDELYRARRSVFKPCTLTAVPYYAWGNREAGRMRVWLAESER